MLWLGLRRHASKLKLRDRVLNGLPATYKLDFQQNDLHDSAASLILFQDI